MLMVMEIQKVTGLDVFENDERMAWYGKSSGCRVKKGSRWRSL